MRVPARARCLVRLTCERRVPPWPLSSITARTRSSNRLKALVKIRPALLARHASPRRFACAIFFFICIIKITLVA